MTDATKAANLSMPLTGAEADVLAQLFLNGPTWDGDITSKSGRDCLFAYGLANRVEGWSYITRKGLEAAIAANLDRTKERRERERNALDRSRSETLDIIADHIAAIATVLPAKAVSS